VAKSLEDIGLVLREGDATKKEKNPSVVGRLTLDGVDDYKKIRVAGRKKNAEGGDTLTVLSP